LRSKKGRNTDTEAFRQVTARLLKMGNVGGVVVLGFDRNLGASRIQPNNRQNECVCAGSDRDPIVGD
jgi:hypothetical protein